MLNLVFASAVELDGVVYAQMGALFARGEFTEALKGVFPPLFPLLIGFSHLLVPNLELAGRTVSMVFGVLLIVTTYRFLRKNWGERIALYGAFFVAFHPYLTRYSTQVLSESLAIFLFTAAVFSFYPAWREGDGRMAALAGCLLGLLYLTRPEYVVYPLPFAVLLLLRKRYVPLLWLCLCFGVLAVPYLFYMRLESGLWVISKKAILMQSVAAHDPTALSYAVPARSFGSIVTNVPSVFYHFLAALFPPFAVLAVMGFKRTERDYLVLLGAVLAVHVLSLALITSSTRRFSVELVPACTLLVAFGTMVVTEFLGRYPAKRLLVGLLAALLLVACVSQGITLPNRGRALQKEAGLYLLSQGQGKKVLARIPLVPFYSGGTWVPMRGNEGCEALLGLMKEGKAEFVIFEDGLERDYPKVKECVPRFYLLKGFRAGEAYVDIYRVRYE
jgi:4-amino-4-deoxy-L-arabinose transferase-like glycosyltransferase